MTSLPIAAKAYTKCFDEVSLLEDTLDSLNIELGKVEDTWLELTPVMSTLQTSIDVIEHILREKSFELETHYNRLAGMEEFSRPRLGEKD